MKNQQHYQMKLTTRLNELQARLAKVEDLLDDPVDPSFADQATEREGDEVLEGLGQASEKEVRLIHAALQRLEEGTYGQCLQCGDEISAERLEVVPHATLCRVCAQ